MVPPAHILLSRYRLDLLVLSTAIGLMATIAAPWLEFRGVFQSWRIDEWHTFWRGDNAFLLGDLVAPDYQIPIEHAQPRQHELVVAAILAGTPVALWYLGATLVLAYYWLRPPELNRSTFRRFLRRLSIFGLVLSGSLLVFAWLFALPSSISLKVDFRTPADLHSGSLAWSDVTVLPVTPLLASLASLVQIALLWEWVRAMAARTATLKPMKGA